MSSPRGVVRTEDFFGLKNELFRKSKLYVDPDFTPSTSSLTFTGELPRISGLRSIIWKRPRVSIICTCSTMLFTDFETCLFTFFKN